MKISLTNVRGFEGNHVFDIRPLTILIGENSSGKTTLLASIFAALSTEFPTSENLFNKAPFELGSFDTIATYRGGSYGRASFFSLGWEGGNEKFPTSVTATFKSHGGTPRLDQMIVTDATNVLTVDAVDSGFEFEFTYRGLRRGRSVVVPAPKKRIVKFKADLKGTTFRLHDTFRYYLESLNSGQQKRQVGLDDMFAALHELTFGGIGERPHVTALAPMRTRPKRTYDELNGEFKPEGDHIPLVLARLIAAKQTQSAELDALTKYGLASGLFEKIDVKRLGRQPSEPFQVRVKMKGPDANIIDVGYGVSQSLPIVIDSIMAPNKEVLLIQQPEVHLHPKAQAALGSFFVEMVANSGKQFIVETHSDYLVDRIRIAVAKKEIPAAKVQLLYLERDGLDIKVHQLNLDDVGNITNAPANYRNFFLEEEMNLMSRGA